MILSHCFLIWSILEARAEIQKYFSLVFGSNWNFEVCFWTYLTFTALLFFSSMWLRHWVYVPISPETKACMYNQDLHGYGNKNLKIFFFVCLPLLSSRPFIPRQSNSFSLVSVWFIINQSVSDRNFPFLPPISRKTNLPIQTRMNIEIKKHSLDETKLLVDWNKFWFLVKGGKNTLLINTQSNQSYFKICELFVQTSKELHFIHLAEKEWMGYFCTSQTRKMQ